MRILIAIVGLLCACSSTPTSSGGAADADDADVATDGAAADTQIAHDTASDTSTTPESDAGCHALEQRGGTVSFVGSTTRPAMNGGTIADGTYVLNRLEWFAGGGAPAISIAQTIAVTGGQLRTVETSDEGTRRTTHAIQAVAPGYLQLDPVCPSDLSGNKPAPYNASASELILADDDFKMAFYFKKL